MLTIKCIPAFNDNYIWLIVDDKQRCCVVDPGDAQPVLDYLAEHQLTLTDIWVTHHHADHCGGIAALKAQFPALQTYGPASEKIAGLDHQLSEGDSVSFADCEFEILALPGHTLGHIGYYHHNTLFCGDVLFSGGCGRVFEGTYQQMFDSLNKIKGLPLETLVFPAHEYTQANLAFALAVEPSNTKLKAYSEQVEMLRRVQQPSVPTKLSLELEINPFLRADVIDTRQWDGARALATPIEVFSYLREWKNRF